MTTIPRNENRAGSTDSRKMCWWVCETREGFRLWECWEIFSKQCLKKPAIDISNSKIQVLRRLFADCKEIVNNHFLVFNFSRNVFFLFSKSNAESPQINLSSSSENVVGKGTIRKPLIWEASEEWKTTETSYYSPPVSDERLLIWLYNFV